MRYTFTRVCRQAEVVPGAGGWSMALAGLPMAADGPTLDEALDELVDVRARTSGIGPTVRYAPNYRDYWGPVKLVALSDNHELKEWLAGVTP